MRTAKIGPDLALKFIQFHSCPVFPSIAQLLRYCGKRQKHITLEKVISRRCKELKSDPGFGSTLKIWVTSSYIQSWLWLWL